MVTTISQLPGVSRAVAADLDALGLTTTSDLLRMNPAGLMHRRPALKGPKVMRWVLYAHLLEIDGMTLDVARSLVDGGISGLDELHGATLSRLQAMVPSAPADDVVDWMRDALRLTLSGVVNGTVTLRDGTPVDRASVTVGGISAETDRHGRFRVVRLRLGRRVTVTILHPTLGYRMFRGVSVHPRASVVGRTFTLSGRPQRPKVLSELRGDRLPPIGTASMTTRVVQGVPDHTDILVLLDRYANGDGRCASRFLDFDEGRFVRRVYRIAKAQMTARAKPGTDLVARGARWVAVPRHSAEAIERSIRARKVIDGFRGAPADVQDAHARVVAIVTAASDRQGRS
jgi:hypothetical protein